MSTPLRVSDRRWTSLTSLVMLSSMPAPHRLASLFACLPDEARAELRGHLTAARGSVRAAARALRVTDKAVHGWVSAWGLRDWLAREFPAAERIGSAQKRRRSDQSTAPMKKNVA